LSYQARLAVPIPATLQKAGDRGKSSFNLSDFSQWIISAMLRSVQVFEEPEVLLLAIQAFVEASLKKSSLFHGGCAKLFSFLEVGTCNSQYLPGWCSLKFDY